MVTAGKIRILEIIKNILLLLLLLRVMCAWLPFVADCTTTDLLAMLCLEVLSVSVLPICSERKKEKNNACGC